MLYSRSLKFAIDSPRIFTARRCDKAAGMLCAFQGFIVLHGGKKTGKGRQMAALASIKRYIVFLLLTVTLSALFAPIAYADLITWPENDFYKQHHSQIVYLGRSFTANGEDGSVAVKQAPGSKSDIATIQNSEVVYIQYSCLYDGDYWGFTFEYSGWVELDQTLVLYDYVAFEEDHLLEFHSYTGDYAEIKELRAAVAWPWPGSEAPLWTFEDLDTENFNVAYAYADDQGREWGFVTYLYGSRNIWICLSDPLNRDMPVFHPAQEPSVWKSETVYSDIGKSWNPPIVLIIVLVAALAIGTVILIKIFWKPAGTTFEN